MLILSFNYQRREKEREVSSTKKARNKIQRARRKLRMGKRIKFKQFLNHSHNHQARKKERRKTKKMPHQRALRNRKRQ
jgi:hypothetical protein